jgi:hypothetical protein
VVRLGLLAISSLVAACSGIIVVENLENLDPKEARAQELWFERALPTLQNATCVACHGGEMPDIAYIEGRADLDKRETLVAYVPRVVNLGAPASSRILTVSQRTEHPGPALTSPQASSILAWIVAERDVRPSDPPLRTAPMALQLCTAGQTPCPINTIDLTPLGADGSVELVAEALGPDLYITGVKIKAGAQGLYIEHPLFESWPAGATVPEPDPIDRYFAIQQNLAPNAEFTPGLGTATLTGFAPTDQLSIRFDVVEPQRMSM